MNRGEQSERSRMPQGRGQVVLENYRRRPWGRAGTLLVWRDGNRTVQHAAVTLGAGWALHKPSQGWMSPTKVLTVRDAILSARYAGHHLQCRTLLS
jgi:cell wall-associated NlpC family hydrolase